VGTGIERFSEVKENSNAKITFVKGGANEICYAYQVLFS
jgi:hypothetical protein